ncbi:hypothetical protein BO78DRAFT_396387, partial [Aspergillus sclerotiicarbonarius CBS 121057]
MALVYNLFYACNDADCLNSISGGGIAGIVLGAIAGTLLILWLFRLCSIGSGGESDYGETNLATRTRHRRRRSPTFYYVEKPRGEVRRPAKVYL